MDQLRRGVTLLTGTTGSASDGVVVLLLGRRLGKGFAILHWPRGAAFNLNIDQPGRFAMRRSIVGASLGALLLLSTAANAIPVTYDFSGTV
jgi:hypothetical protein